MKKIITISCILFSLNSAQSAVNKSHIEKKLPSKLNSVSKVEIIKLKRNLDYFLAFVLYPHLSFDGIKEYRAVIRFTKENKEELDFDCDLYHHYRMTDRKYVIGMCFDIAKSVKFEELSFGKYKVEIAE
jgi:hypothetical protein